MANNNSKKPTKSRVPFGVEKRTGTKWGSKRLERNQRSTGKNKAISTPALLKRRNKKVVDGEKGKKKSVVWKYDHGKLILGKNARDCHAKKNEKGKTVPSSKH